jgi:type IV pilus assembly protein PilF
MACALSACSTTVPQLDTLTHAEPDSTRQRAMRRLSLASAYFEQNQHDVAQQEVRAALQIDPSYADAYSLLGLIHQRANAPVLAQQSFEQAVQLASQAPVRSAELGAIQHNYGWFLCEQNRFAEAQTQLERALSQSGYANTDKTNKAIAFCKTRATQAATR